MAGLLLSLIKCVSHKSKLDGSWKKRFRQSISKVPPPQEESLNASHGTHYTPRVQKIKKGSKKRQKLRKCWKTGTRCFQFTQFITSYDLLILKVKFLSYLLLPFETTIACMWAKLILCSVQVMDVSCSKWHQVSGV